MKTISALLAFAIVATFATGCAQKTTTTGSTTSSTVGYSK